MVPVPIKLYFKFEIHNRTYEGHYNYHDFMHYCLIVLHNRYPFLPQELLIARAKSQWANKLKEPTTKDLIDIQDFTVESINSRSQQRRTGSKVTNIRNSKAKRNVLIFDEIKSNDDPIPESSSISIEDNNDNCNDLFKVSNNNYSNYLNRSPILSKSISFHSENYISEKVSPITSNELIFQDVSQKTTNYQVDKCSVSQTYVPLIVDDEQYVSDDLEIFRPISKEKTDKKEHITTTIEMVIDDSQMDFESISTISSPNNNKSHSSIPKVSISTFPIDLELNDDFESD